MYAHTVAIYCFIDDLLKAVGSTLDLTGVFNGYVML